MALYFLYIGLEIKREIIVRTLSKPSNVITLAIAALAGLVMPSFYIKLINGWAIPSARDIAFTLGILALLGARVPAKLKLVITIAIFGDIAAIAIIAMFYTKSLSLLSLSLLGFVRLNLGCTRL